MKSAVVKFLRAEWLQLLFLLVPLAAAALALPYAVNRVPMQWSLEGKVNWTAPKSWGLFLTPGLMVVVIAAVMLFEHFDKQRRSAAGDGLSSHGRATRSIRLIISAFLMLITFVQIAFALGHPLDLTRLLPCGLALLFASMGNLFGKLKPNRYVGIRVTWTMNSEEVWRKTHRLAGHLWTFSSLAMALLVMVIPLKMLPIITGVWLLVLIGVPLLVAWRAAIAERLTKGPQ